MPAAIITGGAVRLGKAFACHLAKKGFDIALHYHSSSKAADEVADQARSCGVRCQVYPCNFKNPQDLETLMRQITGDFPTTALLINSASNYIQENIEQTTTQTLSDTLNINLLAPYLLMREYKRQINRGMIVNILDQAVAKNIPTYAAYSVSKVALAHLTRLAAIEWGTAVRVNGIAPGLILPPAGESEDYLERESQKVPVSRHGSIEDILKGLDYLLDSPFVNGEVLFIDGGQSKSPGWTFPQKT
ncbi:MAG: SDR family oxidoreductase [Nitrospinales bacterium]